MNWLLVIPLGIVAIALIVFLVWRNQKDEKSFEDQLNNDYRKTKDEEGDVEMEEPMK
jgi:FtsZ-interacting cell division protein ZipA